MAVSIGGVASFFEQRLGFRLPCGLGAAGARRLCRVPLGGPVRGVLVNHDPCSPAFRVSSEWLRAGSPALHQVQPAGAVGPDATSPRSRPGAIGGRPGLQPGTPLRAGGED